MGGEMHRFVTVYALTAVLGTGAVILLTPWANTPSFPEPVERVHEALQAHPVFGAFSRTLRANLYFGKPETLVAPVQKSASITKSEPAKSVPAGIPAVSATESTPSPPPPQSGPQTQAAQWAVVIRSDAPVYSTAGKFQRRIAAGTLATVDDVQRTKSGEFAICRLEAQPLRSDPVLLRTSEIEILAGDLSTVGRREKELWAEKARLLARIAEAAEAAKGAIRADNPYAVEYTNKKKAYTQYWKRVKELQALRDKAADADHMMYEDELRSMKGRDILVGTAYEGIKRQYERWNRENPLPPAETAQSTGFDEHLARIEQELAALRTTP